MGEHDVFVRQLHTEHGTGQDGQHLSFDLDRFPWVYSHLFPSNCKAGASDSRRRLARSKVIAYRRLPANWRGRSSRVRASFTVRARPETSLPFSALIAAL